MKTPRFNTLCPDFLYQAVAETAESQLLSASSYVRKALLAQLVRDGVEIDALRRKAAEARAA